MRICLFLFVFLLGLPTIASEDTLDISFPVTKYTLDNGLVVILYEDHSAPIVSYHTWFRVGSKHEEPGKTGLAHLFEHMMFKGTKKFPNKQFDLLLQNNGISNNAFTTRDYTGYYEDLPSGKLEMVMDMESDRMRNLIIDKEMLRAEREVVKEERRLRLDNSVVGKLYEGIYASVFKVHPYRWPVIGYMRDLNSLTVEACQEFYDKFYAPNNAILIIGGDIDLNSTKKLIEKYYGKIPASDLSKQELVEEPAQKRARKLSIPKEVQSVTMSLNYRGAKGMLDENFSLDVFSEALGSGQSSRLYKALINKHQIASSVYTYYNSSPEEGVFHIIASLKPGASSKKAEKIIDAEIRKIQKEGISQRELEKAINSIQAGYVRSLKTISGKTRALALNETVLGDYKYLFKDLKKYASVEVSEVQAVAKKYFSKNQQVLVEVVPKGRKK